MFDDGCVLDNPIDPLAMFAVWPTQQPIVFLHSGRTEQRWSRYSLLAEPERTFCVRLDSLDQPDCDVFAELDRLLSADDALYTGYFAYDVGRVIETLPRQACPAGDWPIIQLHRCPGFAVYDHLHQQWTVHGTWRKAPPDLLHKPISYISSQEPANFRAGSLHPDQSRTEFEHRVQRVLDYIAAGDVFQVNIAQRLTTEVTGSPRALYQRLAAESPAWFGAYMEFPKNHDDAMQAVASISPELFLSVDADGQVITRPMKGTRPASASPRSLRDSEKDQAELNMIVDLMRNDLGRVCTCGSVHVAEPRQVESHPTVHQAVATVAGQLPAEIGLSALLRATLPGGSITGAPKIRAMQIIDELEPVRRHVYCGALGWLRGRQCGLSVAIRTVMLDLHRQKDQAPGDNWQGQASFSVGAGIVADSQPDHEYEETLDKAKAIRRALTTAAS